MNLVAVVGAAGALAALSLSAALVVEKGRHANTRAELAQVARTYAEARELYAAQAARNAAAVAAAAAAAREEVARQMARETEVRRELDELLRVFEESRTAADRQIARLRRENAEAAQWGDVVIPRAWVDFMLERAAGGGSPPD